MFILNILVGIAVLCLGRKLFWLFVGSVGFLIGFDLTRLLLAGKPDSVILVIALFIGLLSALFALFLQKLAVRIAGFIAGGYFIAMLLNAQGLEFHSIPWLSFLIGGIIGTLLVMVLFDWALIALSSVAGATLIVKAFHFSPLEMKLLFITLFLAGILIQASQMRKRKS